MIDKKLEVCRYTRFVTSEALLTTLQQVLQEYTRPSETILRDTWRSALQAYKTLSSDGWYMPPPHGISVLFGTTDEKSRVNYISLRPESMWPKKNIYLEKDTDFAYLYASPVDKQTGIIGDFGMSLYFGKDSIIQKHLQHCLQINKEIAEFIQVGMPFSEVYTFALATIKHNKLFNHVTSTTDPAGQDIGHTIPASYEDWTDEETKLLESGQEQWEEIKNMISQKRKFISLEEKLTFQKGMAVTIEPRLTDKNNPDISMASFHTILLIHKNGVKELLTNFDPIFKIAGMDYMLS